ncbi:MAG: hypothetical protein KC931_25640, partial [Candidatus Omnitrophica bacterium]|nr:hypothetical protein [Candidatus Omnitrophota bacterium]
NTAPHITAVNFLGTNPSPAKDLAFSVLFDEPVTGFDTNSILVSGSGVTIGELETRLLNNQSFEVLLNNCSGAGTIGIHVIAGAGIVDLAGNALATPSNSVLVTRILDLDPPTITGFELTSVNPILVDSATFQVTFSEEVVFPSFYSPSYVFTNLVSAPEIGEYSLASNPTVEIFLGEIEVMDVSSNGTLQIIMPEDGFITDLAGNALLAFTSLVYQVQPPLYYQWALANGLTLGDNDGGEDNPDFDPLSNIQEFYMDLDPIHADTQHKIVGRYAELEGTNYFTVTFPAPLYSTFDEGGYEGYMNHEYPPFYSGYYLQVFTNLFTAEGEEGLSFEEWTPALDEGLPSLTPTHEYRTLRILPATNNLPSVFIEIEVQVGF